MLLPAASQVIYIEIDLVAGDKTYNCYVDKYSPHLASTTTHHYHHQQFPITWLHLFENIISNFRTDL